MRFNEKSELHFAFPFTLVIDTKPLLARARENGVIVDALVGAAAQRQPLASNDTKQWLFEFVGREHHDWITVFNGGTLVFCFLRREDAMFFKLVWG